MSLPPGVIISGQTPKVVDWNAYLNTPAARKQIAAIKEFSKNIKKNSV